MSACSRKNPITRSGLELEDPLSVFAERNADTLGFFAPRLRGRTV